MGLCLGVPEAPWRPGWARGRGTLIPSIVMGLGVFLWGVRGFLERLFSPTQSRGIPRDCQSSQGGEGSQGSRSQFREQGLEPWSRGFCVPSGHKVISFTLGALWVRAPRQGGGRFCPPPCHLGVRCPVFPGKPLLSSGDFFSCHPPRPAYKGPFPSPASQRGLGSLWVPRGRWHSATPLCFPLSPPRVFCCLFIVDGCFPVSFLTNCELRPRYRVPVFSCPFPLSPFGGFAWVCFGEPWLARGNLGGSGKPLSRQGKGGKKRPGSNFH